MTFITSTCLLFPPPLQALPQYREQLAKLSLHIDMASTINGIIRCGAAQCTHRSAFFVSAYGFCYSSCSPILEFIQHLQRIYLKK